ncbi:MAG TPA: glycosyltransferase family 39 protein, partial [Blastocatellia bacterium]|nr:glycosyltransferase family 39 protein [Blastocatellia bacterium]
MTDPRSERGIKGVDEANLSVTLGPADQLIRFTWIILLCCSLGLLASSVYRAITFPFVHDESLSFSIFNWSPGEAVTANNHLLNTWLMHLCSKLLGNAELSLRLPNLLAHALYLACGLLLLKRTQNAVLMIAGFVLLNLNPFLLDFFFLARGYGLALAFMLLSLYLIVRAYEGKQKHGFVKYTYFSVCAGALSVLSNFTLLNFFLPLLLVASWFLLSDKLLRRFSASYIRPALPLFLASSSFLAFVLSETFRLKKGGHLYSGGKKNFLSDTVGSLVHCSLYSVSYSRSIENNILLVLVGLFIILLLVGLCLFLFRKVVPLAVPIIVILTCAVALPTLQHYLGKTLYPTERAALYYVPLLALALVLAFNWFVQLSSQSWKKALTLILPIACASVISWHFYKSFDTRTCYTWPFDA